MMLTLMTSLVNKIDSNNKWGKTFVNLFCMKLLTYQVVVVDQLLINNSSIIWKQ